MTVTVAWDTTFTWIKKKGRVLEKDKEKEMKSR